MDWLVSFLLGLVFIASCVIWIVVIIASFQAQKYLSIKEIVIDDETAKEYEPLLREALKKIDNTQIHPFTKTPIINVR